MAPTHFIYTVYGWIVSISFGVVCTAPIAIIRHARRSRCASKRSLALGDVASGQFVHLLPMDAYIYGLLGTRLRSECHKQCCKHRHHGISRHATAVRGLNQPVYQIVWIAKMALPWKLLCGGSSSRGIMSDKRLTPFHDDWICFVRVKSTFMTPWP